MDDFRSTASCPAFELLSQFADDEIEADGAALVAAHLAACDGCRGLVATLRGGFVAEAPALDGGIGGSGCAGEEILAAYATAVVDDADRRIVEQHLAECDACVSDLTRLYRRLGIADSVAMPVPAALTRAAQAAFEDVRTASVPASASGEPLATRLGRRLEAWLRLPVLVPLSVAAGALLMVAVQPNRSTPSATSELARAVERPQRLRVTVGEAVVRGRPSRHAEQIAVVRRGTVLEVATEERGWYRVRLPENRAGWVEREAFE